MNYGYNGHRPSFKERLIYFFSGRNGTDTICYALFILYIALVILNFFLSSVAVWLFGWCVIGYMWFRIFSRNIYKRRSENDKFKAFLSKITRFFRVKKRAFKERKSFVYKSCPKCKSTLRLSKIKGKHTAKCPRCREEFSVKI